MFSFIKGLICDIEQDHIVLENNGIGYKIFTPAYFFHDMSYRNAEVKIHTYFSVSENGVALYGFSSKEELEMFELLITVNGIGPKVGLAILSTISVDDLRFAIAGGDAKLISTAPGVGNKTAQRVILDLKDKIDFEASLETKLDNGATSNAASSAKNDAVLALTSLGYSSTDALKALNGIEGDNLTAEDLIKEALKKMAFI